jgi:hypothetical protein
LKHGVISWFCFHQMLAIKRYVNQFCQINNRIGLIPMRGLRSYKNRVNGCCMLRIPDSHNWISIIVIVTITATIAANKFGFSGTVLVYPRFCFVCHLRRRLCTSQCYYCLSRSVGT